jgi:hypothetical protein
MGSQKIPKLKAASKMRKKKEKVMIQKLNN